MMSHLGDFHPLEMISPDGSEGLSPMDPTMSMSPSSSTSTAELVSTSAPVNIPVPQNKSEHLAIHQIDDMTMSVMPVMPVSDEFDNSTIFGSFAMTQSLRSNPEANLEAPRTVQRAISTNARMEHPRTPKGIGDEDGGDSNASQSPLVEDPFFPFLNPDLGGDMVASATEMSTGGMSESLVSGVDKVSVPNSRVNPTKKKRWMITKGLSEADICPTYHHHKNAHHGGRMMTSAASTSEVQPSSRPGIPVANRDNGRPAVTRHLSRQGSRGLRRKSSITSNLSYVFGSTIFQSPSRSNASMASEKVNIVTDSLGIYPSMISLTSAEVGLTPFEEELTIPLSGSHPRSVSASSSRQNSRHDLQQDAREGRKGHVRSVSVTSRGSSISLFTTRPIGKEADDRTSLRDEEEAADKLTDVKPTLGRIAPSKKQWQQTMPDLVEGPESDTLTVQSTVRKSLAEAARAMAKVEDQLKRPDGEKEVDEAEEGEGVELKAITPAMYKKNLYVVCAVFFFTFSAYLSLRNLQSSLNDVGGLGMYSLSCVYAFLCIGSLLTTTIVQRLRPKLSMLIGLCGLLIYNSCNFYPTYYTLIPGSCIAGFCLAILWTSQATYMANNAASYAALTGMRFQDCLSSFHGTFFACFQVSQMVGGAISSMVFSLQPAKLGSPVALPSEAQYLHGTNDTVDGRVNVTEDYYPVDEPSSLLTSALGNATAQVIGMTGDLLGNISTNAYSFQSDDYYSPSSFNETEFAAGLLPNGTLCGIRNCPGMSIAKAKVDMDLSFYYIMVGAFICSTVFSISILLFFLDPLEGSMKNPRAGIMNQLLSVFRMLGNPHVICLLPFMGYTLLQATFVFGEFNKAFVTCYLGIHMIGLMTVCLSIFSSFFAFFTGVAQKYVGPEVIIIGGLLAHLAVLASFFIWEPSKDQPVRFFVVVAVWGAGDGILTTLIISLLGVLFVENKEAVFSTYKMTQAASAFVLFVTGPYVCTRTKVIALMVVASLAIVGYVVLKIRLHIASGDTLRLQKSLVSVNVNQSKSKC